MITPNSASTIDGVPANISTVDSTTRASAAGRAYSLSHTATPMPIGVAIASAVTVTRMVPSRSARNPPVSFWVFPTFGLVQSRSGCR